jgi:hypothetical protein
MWLHNHGVTVLRILTDNAMVYRRGRNWTAVCVALGLRRRFTKPGCRGPMARPSGSTTPCSFRLRPPLDIETTSGAPPCPAGSSTTTLDAPTPPSAADPRSPDSLPDNPMSSGGLLEQFQQAAVAGGVVGGVVGPAARRTRVQARARMRTAWGWWAPRARARS